MMREEWRYNLEQALELQPEHISAYHLTIEPQTPFGRQARRARSAKPIRRRAGAQFALLREMLCGAGYEHYEGFELRAAGTPRPAQQPLLGRHPVPRHRPVGALLRRGAPPMERRQPEPLPRTSAAGRAVRNRSADARHAIQRIRDDPAAHGRRAAHRRPGRPVRGTQIGSISCGRRKNSPPQERCRSNPDATISLPHIGLSRTASFLIFFSLKGCAKPQKTYICKERRQAPPTGTGGFPVPE